MAGDNLFEPPAVAAIETHLRTLLSYALDQAGGATSTESLSTSSDLDARLAGLKDELQRGTSEAEAPLILEAASRRVFYSILVDTLPVNYIFRTNITLRPQKSSTAVDSQTRGLWSFLDILLFLSELSRFYCRSMVKRLLTG